MNQQLLLGVRPRQNIRLDDFSESFFSPLCQSVKDVLLGENKLSLFFWGTPLSMSAWLSAISGEAEQQGLASVVLSLPDLVQQASPSLLLELDSLNVLIFDGLDALDGLTEWQEALFHVWNKYQNSCVLIFAANQPLSNFPWLLPDLRSRLQAAVSFSLPLIDDYGKFHLILSMAKRLGWVITDDVAQYLMTRTPRDLEGLVMVLQGLDDYSLVVGRRLTMPLIREFLQNKA